MSADDQWEVEIRFRRNGRCVGIIKALGNTPRDALFNATNDVESALHVNPTGPDAVRVIRDGATQ